MAIQNNPVFIPSPVKKKTPTLEEVKNIQKQFATGTAKPVLVPKVQGQKSISPFSPESNNIPKVAEVQSMVKKQATGELKLDPKRIDGQKEINEKMVRKQAEELGELTQGEVSKIESMKKQGLDKMKILETIKISRDLGDLSDEEIQGIQEAKTKGVAPLEILKVIQQARLYDKEQNAPVDTNNPFQIVGRGARGVANAGRGVYNLIDSAVNPGGKEQRVKGTEFDKKVTDKVLGKADTFGKIAEGAGEAFGQSAMLGPLGNVGKATKALPFLARLPIAGAIGAGEGVVYNAMSNASENRDLGENAGIASAFGAGGGIVGETLGALRNVTKKGAFAGVNKSVQEKAIERFGKNIPELVAEEGIDKTSIRGMRGQIDKKLPQTWKALEGMSENISLSRTEARSTLKESIIKDLGLDKLPKSANRQNLLKNIDEIVDYYIGQGRQKLTGKEIVPLVTDLNSALPANAIKNSTYALNPARETTVLRSMKNGLQTLMEKQVPGVKEAYAKYSKQKVIQEAMKNLEVQKLLTRQLVGGGLGAVAGAAPQLAQGDYKGAAKNALIFGVIGSLAGKATGSPGFLLKTSKGLNVGKEGVDIIRKAFPSVMKNLEKKD